MAELGKIERPSAEDFATRKKLYCVPNVYPDKRAPQEYGALVTRYWDEVARQLGKLEQTGRIANVFCEALYAQGDEALKVLEGVNEAAHRLVSSKVAEGAVLLPLEHREFFTSFLDWRSCLAVVRTEEVFGKVLAFYQEALARRLEHIQRTVLENLTEGQATLLVMVDEDRARLQFPPEVEVFLVVPPSYDDVVRWMRDRAMTGAERAKEEGA